MFLSLDFSYKNYVTLLMSELKTFNILSIDGGGIKGIYPAKVLEQIESKFEGKIVDHFDMICGASTGGLIALALSLNHSAKEIADFYIDRGELIFPNKPRWRKPFSLLKQGFITNKYKSKKIKEELVRFFGEDKKLKDCNSLLCIPAYNVSEGKPIVFKNPHNHLFRDGDLNIIDVALATSAAPTYFKNHKINEQNLPNTLCTDGGVWCNNPALAGLIEAWDYFVGEDKEFDKVRILSLSTIPKPSGEEFGGGSLLKWKDKLINTALEGQSFFTNYFLSKLEENNEFEVEYRRVVPSNISPNQYKKIEMDLASKEAIELLNKIGTSSGVEFVTKENRWLHNIFSSPKHLLISKI